MARIPTYDNLVAPTALPAVQQNINASADMFLDSNAKGIDALGKGLVKAGDSAMFILADQQKMENEARVKEADVKYSDALRAILHDPKNGYLNALGKNAVDGREGVTKAIEDLNASSMEGVQNDTQRRMFASVQAHRRESAMLQVDTHASQQGKLYAVGQSEARAKAQIPDMVLYAAAHGATDQDGKPVGPYATAKATLLSEIDSVGKMTGMSAEQIAEKKRGLLTEAHVQVIQDMVGKKQTKLANDYFKKYGERGEIDETKKAEIGKFLETANVHADGLNLQFDVSKLKTESAQLAEIDKRYKAEQITTEVRDNAKTRVEHDWAKARAARAEGDKAMMGQAQEWVLKNTGKSILDMPPTLYAWSKNSGHLAALDAFAQREGRPGERVKELQVRGAMINQAMSDPDKFIEEFKKTQFGDRMDLGVNGIKEMQNIAGDMIKGNGKYKTEFDAKIMQDAIPKALLANGKKDDRDRFVALQHEAQINWKKANPGKVPTIEDQQKVANSANADWVKLRSGPIWNGDYKAYEVQGKPDILAVPKLFYTEMKKLGASNDQIWAAWNLKNKKKAAP